MRPELPPGVGEWCDAHLGAPPAEALFVVAHLSEVVGVRLTDGREVVVKRRVDDSGRARSCVTAQRLLAEGGFPCPMPLTPVTFGAGMAVHAEQLIPGGELYTNESPAAAERSAALLADLVRRLAEFELDPPLPNPEWVRWDVPPERHAVPGAPAWLEETSGRLHEKLRETGLRPVLGHADWEAQNMRWRDGEPLAVHDWDSLAWLSEAALVGTAAGVFASHDRPTLAPLASSEAFIRTYERARGAGFSSGESEVAWAASIWVALHNARDELIYERPRLSFDRLEAQRAERLARARA